MNGKQFSFTLLVSKKHNYTPASLMRDYTRRNAQAHYSRDYYGSALLLIDGVTYTYDHWKISPYNDALEQVTVYLQEAAR